MERCAVFEEHERWGVPEVLLMTLKPSGESAYQIGKGTHVAAVMRTMVRNGDLPRHLSTQYR